MMETDAEKYRIPLFNGTNFSNWKFRIETLLTEIDLLSYITKPYTQMVELCHEDTPEQRVTKQSQSKENQKKDQKCKANIIQRIADSHLEYAKDKETVFDLWTVLCETFERKGIASQLLIRKSLLSMKFDETKDTLTTHFLKFDKCIRDLRSTGATLEETDIICHLLLTMPSEYDNIVIAIETLAVDNLTLGFVKSRLIDVETKRHGIKTDGEEPTQSSVFASQSKQKPRKGNKNKPTQKLSSTPFPLL